MTIKIMKQHELITQASAVGWKKFRTNLISDVSNDLVMVDWSVSYDAVGHDIIIDAKVKVAFGGDSLLQVWLKDEHPGIWIPELRPWVASVVEFGPDQNIEETHIGLFDSKWRDEDVGETYHALLWGYVSHKGENFKFGFEKEFKYPC